MARLLGGDCTARSEFGKGSIFTFSFVAGKSTELELEFERHKAPQ